MFNVDELWENLLSEEPARIRKAWLDLKDDEATRVLAHLKRMAEEDGWAEVQKQAASAALKVIQQMTE